MSIKDILPTEDHIVRARKLAEDLHNNRPRIQQEMLTEIRRYLVLLKEKDTEEIRNL